jgi:hypothetical protein
VFFECSFNILLFFGSHKIDKIEIEAFLSVSNHPARHLTKPENSGTQKNEMKLIQKQKRSLAENDITIHLVLSATHKKLVIANLLLYGS